MMLHGAPDNIEDINFKRHLLLSSLLTYIAYRGILNNGSDYPVYLFATKVSQPPCLLKPCNLFQLISDI
jgi:hypothetical protein